MSIKRMLAIFRARSLEFYRDRAALGWSFLFPFVVMIGLSFSLDNQSGAKLKVGVAQQGMLAEAGIEFIDYQHIQFVSQPRETGLNKVQDQRLDMFIDGATGEYFINPESSNGYILEKAMSKDDKAKLKKSEIAGEYVRYTDWLMPGILGMNLMFSAMWGVGYVIVRYRRFGVLKRLKATPASPLEFLAAQMLSRLSIDITVLTILFTGLHLIIGFKMVGSILLLALVFILGELCLSSIGLMVAARLKNEELASGLLNVFSWPMMILSGVWFSLEGAHPWILKLSSVLPLTHLVDAARAIMLDGAGFIDILPQLAFLLSGAVLFLLAGALLFKWE